MLRIGSIDELSIESDLELNRVKAAIEIELENRRRFMGAITEKAAGDSPGLGRDEKGRFSQLAVQGCGPSGEEISLRNIDEAMRYQPWNEQQMEAGEIVRDALTAAAKAILRNVPAGRFRSTALHKVVEARMDANAGISFRGRF